MNNIDSYISLCLSNRCLCVAMKSQREMVPTRKEKKKMQSQREMLPAKI